jgi:hypothetical protein
LLLKLVREKLAATTDTRPADGVRVDAVKFSGGVLSLTGAARTTAQRDRVQAILDQGRTGIQDLADVRIQRIDVSGLAVSGDQTGVVSSAPVSGPCCCGSVPVTPCSECDDCQWQPRWRLFHRK